MTTQEVANQYCELARQNKWREIQEAFHDEDIICQEPEHVALRGMQVITKGKKAVEAKTKASREMIETIHSQYCSEPIVAGDVFSVSLKRDITLMNKSRMAMEEIGVFQVKGGKIVSELFFY